MATDPFPKKKILVIAATHCVKSVHIQSYSDPYSVQMRENTNQNNSEDGHLLHSENLHKNIYQGFLALSNFVWFLYFVRLIFWSYTNLVQNMKFSIKYFFSKCDQIRRKLRIWSHLLKKSLMENFIFCAVKLYCRTYANVLHWMRGWEVKNTRPGS